MAQLTAARKGQFSDPNKVKAGMPRRVSADSWGYTVAGPNGSTERVVKVDTKPTQKQPGKPKTTEQRAAERAYASADACELRNIRKDLVKLGPSIPSARDVLAQLWRIEIALGEIADEAPRISYARTIMRRARPDASPADINAVITEPRVEPWSRPTRRTAGKAIGLTSEIWEASGPPNHVWPIDRNDTWVLEAIAEKAAIKKSAREKRCKDKKKKPKGKTQAEIAKELGIPLRTYERRLKAEREAAKGGSGGKSGNASTVSTTTTDTYCSDGSVARNSATEPAPCAPLLDEPTEDNDMPIPDDADEPAPTPDRAPARAADDAGGAVDAQATEMPASGPDSAAYGDAGDDGEDASPAFQAAVSADARARARSDTIGAGSLLWIAAANASPPVPVHIREADDDVLASHLLAMGHLSEAELAWIMTRPRLGRAA